jgi:hypothetical protein
VRRGEQVSKSPSPPFGRLGSPTALDRLFEIAGQEFPIGDRAGEDHEAPRARRTMPRSAWPTARGSISGKVGPSTYSIASVAVVSAIIADAEQDSGYRQVLLTPP